VNPDGYIYNESTNPNGGGLWRKNRRPISGNGMGVDLNRNYGYEWGFDNIGSSTNPVSETYRGTEGFSEPETQAVRDFSIKHDFKITLNYHTFGNLLIYPWGFSDSPTPDDLTFKGFSEAMTVENNFLAGTGLETVGYTVNGDSDDWMYAERGSFALTPEVGSGSFGFWPPREAIDELNKSVLAQNMIAAKLLHNYAQVDQLADDGDTFRFSVKKYSLDSSAVTVQLRSLNEGLILNKDEEMVEHPVFRQRPGRSTSHVEVANPRNRSGHQNHFNSYVKRDTLSVFVGDSGISTIFEDVVDDFGMWNSGSWGTTDAVFYSETSSLTDSPSGLYPANKLSALNINEPIDLTEVEEATLKFQTRWEIEADFDYAQVLISNDGTNFAAVCGKYTNAGSSFQDEGEPVYDGAQQEWVEDEVEQQDGMYIDDIKVEVRAEVSSSTSDLDEVNEYDLVPNPFIDNFHVVSEKGSDHEMVIYDEMGRKVKREGLPAGIYFVEVKVNGQRKAMLKAIKIK